MKNLKEITYSKQKLNAKIIKHFEEIGVFEYSESKLEKEIKTEFQFEFTDVDINEAGKYEFLIVYNNNCKSVIDFEKTLVYAKDIEGTEHKLTLKPDCHNPNKPLLYTVIKEMTDKQDKRDSENEKSAKDIEDTQNWLNKNCI